MKDVKLDLRIDYPEDYSRYIEDIKKLVNEVRKKSLLLQNQGITGAEVIAQQMENLIDYQKAALTKFDNYKFKTALNTMIRSINQIKKNPYTDDEINVLEQFRTYSNTSNILIQSSLLCIQHQIKDFGYIQKGEDLIKETEATIEEFLCQYGWFITDRLNVNTFKKELGKRASEKITYEMINEVMEKCYIELEFDYFEDIFIIWKTKLNRDRMEIIEDALWAFKHKKYNLVIPILYTQMEGIMWEDISDEEVRKHVETKSDTWIGNNERIKGFVKKHNLDSVIGVKELIIDNIFCNWNCIKINDNNNTRVFTGNRNEILHGRTLDYGTFNNALRAFMLFDHIIKMI